MYLLGVSSVRNYLEMLKGRESEAELLAADLMIGVASFFRDRVAWSALRTEVAAKIAADNASSPIRVWMPACATGEDAYAIAMMLHHELALAGGRGKSRSSPRTYMTGPLKGPGRQISRRHGSRGSARFHRLYVTYSEDGLSVIINEDIRKQVVFAKQDILIARPRRGSMRSSAVTS